MEFLAFIYENNGKLGENEGEMSHVACEEENEENRGLIDKNSYEDQLASFCSDFCQL
ncbi:hypothetical protein HJW54_22275, partial [Bacteroides uniformis]|nr:hypothetical protein [Bacteroides uniformis]